MKRFLMGVALAFAAGGAQADQGAIQGVIGAQIEALQEKDVETAFAYAAPNIQGMFRTPDSFGTMVRMGYPMVWNPGTVEYLSTDVMGIYWRQEVLITDAQGRSHMLRYAMVETNGGWKIAGVRVLMAPDVGV